MEKKQKKKKYRKGAEKVNSTIFGVAWYSREQWCRLLTISSDRDALEDTYDEWLETAEKQLSQLTDQGYVIRKVDIDVEELLGWCNSQLRQVDGKARSAFTSIKLRELEQG